MHEEKTVLIPFTGSDYSPLVALGETSYAGREISRAQYLKWEYDENPSGHAIIHVAQKAGEVAAQYLVVPHEYSINDSVVKGSLSANTLTHPGSRGQNLFARLAALTFSECEAKKILFTIGFPNPLSLPVIQKKKIFTLVGSLPLLLKPLNPVKTVYRAIANVKNKSGEEIDLDLNRITDHGKAGISKLDLSADKDSYEKLLGNFNRHYGNLTHRSAAHLKWRYCDIPFRKYYLLKLTEGEEMKAAFIIRCRYLFGLRTIILTDIIATEKLSAAMILKYVSAVARHNRIDQVIATVPRHCELYNSFKREGYFSVPRFLLPQEIAFIVRTHDKSCQDQVSDFTKWFLTFGDYDIF